MNIVDSSGWLAYFADEPTADFFAEPIECVEDLLVPSITLYEVFKVLLREAGKERAFQGVAVMLQGRIVELNTEYSLESAAIGLAEGLAVADSIIYATALKCDGILWTQDVHFEGKANVKYTSKVTEA